jgi:membrane protein
MISSVILVPGFFAFYFLIKRIREYGITENILAYIGSIVFVAFFYLKDNGKLKILGFYEYIFVVLVCSFLLALIVYIMRTESLYKDIIYLPILTIVIVIWKYSSDGSPIYYLLLVFVLIDYLLRSLFLKKYKAIALIGSFIVYFALSVSNSNFLGSSNIANKEKESLGSELRDGSENLGNDLTLFVDEKISFPREFKFTMKYNNFETTPFRTLTYKVKTPDEEEHNEVEISGTRVQEKVDIRKGYNKDNESLVNAIKFLVGRDIANKLHDEMNANFNNFYDLSKFRYYTYYDISGAEEKSGFLKSENIKLKENQDAIVFLLNFNSNKKTKEEIEKDFLVDFSEEEQIKTIKNLMKTKVLKDVNKKEYLVAFSDYSYNEKDEQIRNVKFVYNVSIKDNGEINVEKSTQ